MSGFGLNRTLDAPAAAIEVDEDISDDLETAICTSERQDMRRANRGITTAIFVGNSELQGLMATGNMLHSDPTLAKQFEQPNAFQLELECLITDLYVNSDSERTKTSRDFANRASIDELCGKYPLVGALIQKQISLGKKAARKASIPLFNFGWWLRIIIHMPMTGGKGHQDKQIACSNVGRSILDLWGSPDKLANASGLILKLRYTGDEYDLPGDHGVLWYFAPQILQHGSRIRFESFTIRGCFILVLCTATVSSTIPHLSKLYLSLISASPPLLFGKNLTLFKNLRPACAMKFDLNARHNLFGTLVAPQRQFLD
jgi:hypothetical protein